MLDLPRTIDKSIDFEHIFSFLKTNGGNTLAHLIFLGDKEVYWAKDRQVLIVFKRIANKLIVLGDPIGKDDCLKSAIIEFHTYCKRFNLKPVFYQISPKYLTFYHEAGYRFFQVGEEAKLDLLNFNIDGKKGAKLRTRKHKFERKGYHFKVVAPPYTEELLLDLEKISNSWLYNRKEQSFSVGFFCKKYISRFPIALLLNPDGNIVAFASLASDCCKSNMTITIDLMRYEAQSSHGTMDFLFLSIFFWAKENGYRWCSLGMAPLSNVGQTKNSKISEKIARLVFLYGNYFYKFKGLKEYKSKFASTWEPKYLAYQSTLLPEVILQLVLLIHNKTILKKKRVP